MNNLANSDQTSELVKFFFLSNCACTHQGAVIGLFFREKGSNRNEL